LSSVAEWMNSRASCTLLFTAVEPLPPEHKSRMAAAAAPVLVRGELSPDNRCLPRWLVMGLCPAAVPGQSYMHCILVTDRPPSRLIPELFASLQLQYYKHHYVLMSHLRV
jgi:hypothetical protein